MSSIHVGNALKLHPSQVVDRLQPSQTFARFRTTAGIDMVDAIKAGRMRLFGVASTPPMPEIIRTDERDSTGSSICHHVYSFQHPQPQTIQMLESIYGRRLPERIQASAHFFNAIPDSSEADRVGFGKEACQERDGKRIWHARLSLFAELKRLGARLEHAGIPGSLEEFNERKLQSFGKRHVDTEMRATLSAEGVSLTLVFGGSIYESPGGHRWVPEKYALGVVAELVDEKMYNAQEGNSVMRNGLNAIIGHMYSSTFLYFGENPNQPLHELTLPLSFHKDGLSRGLIQQWGIALDESALDDVEIPAKIDELNLSSDGKVHLPESSE